MENYRRQLEIRYSLSFLPGHRRWPVRPSERHCLQHVSHLSEQREHGHGSEASLHLLCHISADREVRGPVSSSENFQMVPSPLPAVLTAVALRLGRGSAVELPDYCMHEAPDSSHKPLETKTLFAVLPFPWGCAQYSVTSLQRSTENYSQCWNGHSLWDSWNRTLFFHLVSAKLLCGRQMCCPWGDRQMLSSRHCRVHCRESARVQLFYLLTFLCSLSNPGLVPC